LLERIVANGSESQWADASSYWPIGITGVSWPAEAGTPPNATLSQYLFHWRCMFNASQALIQPL
jgi:hypothetical protein